jgi:hypothetical protein
MSLGYKLVVSALIAAAVVIVASAVVIALPNAGGYSTSAIPANQQSPSAYSQGGGYNYRYSGSGHGGCMGDWSGSPTISGSYGDGMGYCPNGAAWLR